MPPIPPLKLLSLTVEGFKNFTHQETIQFHSGLNSIEGNNGVGKSNLLDALLYAMGVRKDSRSDHKSALIYGHGVRDYKFAEVTLRLRVCDREYTIVCGIDGQGETLKVAIGEGIPRNWKRDTLSKLFLRAHVNTAHPTYFVQQGSIQDLATMTRTQLRAHLEHWFGFSSPHSPFQVILKLEKRYLEARKYFLQEFENDVRPKLLRICLAEGELTFLKEEKERARILQELVHKIDYSHKCHQALQHDKQVQNEKRIKAQLEKDIAELEEKVAKLEELHYQQTGLGGRSTEQRRLFHEKENLQLRAEKLAKLLERLETEGAKANEEVQNLQAEIDAVKNRIEKQTLAIEQAVQWEARAERDVQNQKQDILRVKESSSSTYELLKAQLAKCQSAIHEANEEISNALEKFQYSHKQSKYLMQQMHQKTILLSQQSEPGQFNQQQQDLARARLQTNQEVQEAKNRVLTAQSRIAILENMRAPDVPLHIQLPPASGDFQPKKCLGYLHELFDILPEHREHVTYALQRILGVKLFNIIVEDAEAMHQLHKRNLFRGKHSFFLQLSLQVAPDMIPQEVVDQLPGTVYRAFDLLWLKEARLGDLFKTLLGGYLVVRDFEQAKEVSTALTGSKWRLSITDLKGNLINTDGTVMKTGKEVNSPFGNILAYHRRRREIAKLREEAEQMQIGIRDQEKQLQTVEEQKLKHLREKEKYEELKSSMAEFNQKELELKTNRDILDEEIKTLNSRKAGLEEEARRLKTELEGARKERSSQEQEPLCASAEKRLAELQKKAERASAARLQEKQKKASEELILRRLEDAQADAQLELQDIERRFKNEKKELKETEQALVLVGEQDIRLTAKSVHQEQQAAEMAIELEQSRELLEDLRKDRQEREIQLYRLGDISELRAEIEELQKLPSLQNYEIQSEEKLEQYNLEKLRKKCADAKDNVELCQARLQEFKHVNTQRARAMLEEGMLLKTKSLIWANVLPQLSHFARRLVDMHKLKNVLEMNKEIMEIADKMEPDIIAGIFPEFAEAEDHHHPPQLNFRFKYAQNGELRDAGSELSGGQRTMIAIVVTLAFQKVAQTPLLLLDEADAALDVINSKKFAKGLKAILGEAQAVAISHRSDLVDHADRVFEVKEKGRPRVLQHS